jgi:hypothetical protein
VERFALRFYCSRSVRGARSLPPAAPQQEAEEVQQTTVKARQNLQQRDSSGFAATDSLEVQQQQPLATPIFMLPAGTTSLPNLERMPVLPHETNTISDFTGFAEILNYLGVSTTRMCSAVGKYR